MVSCVDISNCFEMPMEMISHGIGDFERDQVDSYLHPHINTDVQQKVSEVLLRLTPYAAVIMHEH